MFTKRLVLHPARQIRANHHGQPSQKKRILSAGRFNERLVLSLASNPACIIMDDELNILPTSSHVKDIVPLQRNEDGSPAVPPPRAAGELKELAASLQDTMVRQSLAGA